jgi:hypothetical protein
MALAICANLNENENPLVLVNGILADRGVLGQPMAIEETVRYFCFAAAR